VGGLDVSAEKNLCVCACRYQNAERNGDVKIDNRSFENVAKSKYFRTTVTKIIHE